MDIFVLFYLVGILIENETKKVRRQSSSPISSIWYILAVFWHPEMSRFLMEPIRDHEDFQRIVRNVQQGPKQPNG